MNAKACLLTGCLVSFLALSAAAGNTCTWQGGSGKFSDANWDIAPVSGNDDTLVFDTSNGTAITVENDLADDFAIYALKTCAGSDWASYGTITLTGKRLYFNATSSRSAITVIECGTGEPNRGAPLTFDAPLRFKGGNMKFSNTAVFNGKISIDDNGAISVSWPYPRSTSNIKKVTFNGEIYGPNAQADIVPGNGGYGSRLDFNGKLTLRELYNNGAFANGKPQTYFNASGNAIATFIFRYNHQIYVPVANAFDDQTVIRDVSAQAEMGMITFQADQVVDRLTVVADQDPNHACRYTADRKATLTMRARASTTVANTFEDKLSLVWDPLEDYTFTLCEHSPSATNTMSGTVEVKGGTFALKDGATLPKISGVTVRSGATFALTNCTAALPIPTTATLSVETGATVAIPAGMTLVVANIFVDGEPLFASGRYTKDNCSWIAGDGAVEYRPVMTSTCTLAMNESLFEQTKCWTNKVLGLSVPPKEADAANFDYLVVHSLRTPQPAGTFDYRGRRMIVGEVGGSSGALVECEYTGVATNRVLNEGLFLAKGGISFNGGRFGSSTWTGKITVLSPQGADVSLVGGYTNDTLAAHLYLSGQLFGAAGVGFKAGGGQNTVVTGQRITIDADASEYYGRLQTYAANSWVTIGNTVFNGSVECQEGCAFGTELATDTAQLKDLSFDAATPLVVPVAAASKTDGTAGLIVVTNSFAQSAKVTVYHRGRMWHGRTPILKLAAGCSGTLDVSQFAFGGYMTKFRVPSDDAQANWPRDLRLEVTTENGEQILSIVSDRPGLGVIVR